MATFHALGLSILREHPDAAGLGPDFAVADDAQRAAARAIAGADDGRVSSRLLRERNLVDLDELVDPAGRAAARRPRAGRGLPARAGRGCSWTSTRTSTPTSTSCCGCWCPTGRQRLRDRRPGPGDLLVPRRRRRLLPAVPGGLHRRPGGPADPQLPLGGADHRGRGRRPSRRPRWCAAAGWSRPGSSRTRRRSGCTRRPPSRPRRSGSPPPSTSWSAASRTARSTRRVDSRAGRRRVLSFADIAVLYRTDAQAAPIVEALTAANIPVQKRSHDRLRRPAGGGRDRPRAALRRRRRRADRWPTGSARSAGCSPPAGRHCSKWTVPRRPCSPRPRCTPRSSCCCRWPPGAATTWRRSCRRWRWGPRSTRSTRGPRR